MPRRLFFSPRDCLSSLRCFSSFSFFSSIKRALVIAISLSLSACIGGRSEPVSYQLLTPRAEPNTAAPLTGRTIGVGPVQIAQFLQRPQIVTHNGGSALQVDPILRWGEPLEQGIQRVLLQNISALTGAETRNFPWRQNATPEYAVRIDVIDFDKLASGETTLEVNWIVEDLKTARILKTQQQRIRSSKDYDDVLLQLAQQIASTLTPSP